MENKSNKPESQLKDTITHSPNACYDWRLKLAQFLRNYETNYDLKDRKKDK